MIALILLILYALMAIYVFARLQRKEISLVNPRGFRESRTAQRLDAAINGLLWPVLAVKLLIEEVNL